MKKILILVLALALLMPCVAGCGQKAENAPKEASDFPIWKTITLAGSLKAGPDGKPLESDGIQFSERTQRILGQLVATAKETKLNLVKLTASDMGFSHSQTYSGVCAKALEMGLALCPPEVGPYLRTQYKNQPSGEYLVLGMTPIRSFDGFQCVFAVSRDVTGLSGLFLSSCWYDLASFWHSGGPEFVFVRPR